MSEFRTIIDIEESKDKIKYGHKVLFIGSCFTENIGQKLDNYKFTSLINPFGIVYNPVSVRNTILAIIENRCFTEKDLIYNNNTWNSFFHHSRFSNIDREECLKNINESLVHSSEFLKETDFLIITFGTSWVYEYVESGDIVSNCHKFPSYKFKRYRLTVDYIISIYEDIISKIRKVNPRVKILFTISPIRHWKDGAHGNQLSKAVLQLAIDGIVEKLSDTFYFPSYEIMMDDLRDYRFYGKDMIHVSEEAVDYIWRRFMNTYIDAKSLSLMKRIDKINKALSHRPFSDSSDTYSNFLLNQLIKIEQLEKECEHLDFSEEKKIIKMKTEK